MAKERELVDGCAYRLSNAALGLQLDVEKGNPAHNRLPIAQVFSAQDGRHAANVH